jgi:nitrous oxidase accessory protein
MFILVTLKDSLARHRKLIDPIKYFVLGIAFVYIGLVLKAQPTTTNIVILINALKKLTFPLDLFLLEPFIFMTFSYMFIVLIIWGRGAYCGWLCPYGALVDLLHWLYRKVVPKLTVKISYKVHSKLVYIKDAVLLAIIGASLYSFMLSEYMTEVEPFRTLVLKLDREWYFVAYFAVLTLGSLVVYRAFCRYLCPLGAALAIPSGLRIFPLIKIKRYDLCGSCRICEKQCRIQAISPKGVIQRRQCFECLDCQANYYDESVCPKLKLLKRSDENKPAEAFPKMAAISLLITLSIILVSVKAAEAGTLIVGEDHKSIQSAISAAKDGDLIEVMEGTYSGNISINKSVHLRGINLPVLTAQAGYIIDITSPGVIVEGFKIEFDSPELGLTDTGIFIAKGADDVLIKDNIISRIMFGIWNVEGRNIQIIDNKITGMKDLDRNKRGNCINLTGSQQAQIKGNILKYCRDGIYMEISHDAVVTGNNISFSRYSVHTMWVDRGKFNDNIAHDNLVGLAIMYSRYSDISRNLSYGNLTNGLLLNQSVRSTITSNKVIGNTKGVFLYNSILNMFEDNLIMNNQLGIHSWGGSEKNTIKGNSFINNEVQVKHVASRDQQWEGNFWSDYLGWDMTDDGVGDYAYESSSLVDYIFWRYPAARVLYSSPAMHVLWMIEKQFPIIDVPKVVDNKPLMEPIHEDWASLKKEYANYVPDRYYGEIKKLDHIPGGGRHR